MIYCTVLSTPNRDTLETTTKSLSEAGIEFDVVSVDKGDMGAEHRFHNIIEAIDRAEASGCDYHLYVEDDVLVHRDAKRFAEEFIKLGIGALSMGNMCSRTFRDYDKSRPRFAI